MGTPTIVVVTLVHVMTRAVVRHESVSRTATAHVSTVGILAVLITAAVVLTTLVHVILTAGAKEPDRTDATVVHTATTIVTVDAATHSIRHIRRGLCKFLQERYIVLSLLVCRLVSPTSTTSSSTLSISHDDGVAVCVIAGVIDAVAMAVTVAP